MPRFIKKPVAVEAYQWEQVSEYVEGKKRDVDYYRTPDLDGEDECRHCGLTMHDHGWIDTLEGGILFARKTT